MNIDGTCPSPGSFTTSTGINPGTFNYELYGSITLNGTTTFNTGQSETFRFVNYMSITPGSGHDFSVPAGTSLLLLPTPCN